MAHPCPSPRPWLRPARRLAALALFCLPAGGAAIAADEAAQEDWPCVQRLMPEISSGMIWSGPPLDAAVAAVADSALRTEAADLAARRVPLEEAAERVDALAIQLAPDQKSARLTALFLETLEIINRDRASIIQGIYKFARGQRTLAQKIKTTNQKIEAMPKDRFLERDALAAERDWDIRVFEDRRGALVYLCEQPVLLEQRAFALARLIAGHVEEK